MHAFSVKSPGDGIHEAVTHQIYKQVCTCAILLEDTGLLAQLTAGDMVVEHASHAAHNGHQKILIWTVDTDVVVLSVYVAQSLGPEYELDCFWNWQTFLVPGSL